MRDAVRAAGGLYISVQFTLVPGRDGEPLISPHLKRLRPFLSRGDFAPGAFGHRLVDALAPADFTAEKVAYSAFYQTRLEYILRATGIERLIAGGMVTNGGVASTLRDAHLRDIETILLSDGCAAFRPEVHEATLISLGSVTEIAVCGDAAALIRSAARASPAASVSRRSRSRRASATGWPRRRGSRRSISRAPRWPTPGSAGRTSG